MKRIILNPISLGAVIGVAAIFFVSSSLFAPEGSFFAGPQTQHNTQPISLVEEEREPKTLTLMFVGDIMLDRGVRHSVETNAGGDWTFLLKDIQPTLQEADILFGNLESVISNQGRNVGSIYSFRAPPSSIEALTLAGFDILSVANNHSFDWTLAALEDSNARLADAGIRYVGGGSSREETERPVIIERGGMRIAFLAYTAVGAPNWQATDERGGIAWIEPGTISKMEQAVADISESADIIIVSAHIGEEYQVEPTPFQEQLAKAAIDAGADLFVGHHAHVLQPVEQYGDGWIAYGMGNFLFDQAFSEETMTGGILKVTLSDGAVDEVTLLKTRQNASFQIRLLEE